MEWSVMPLLNSDNCGECHTLILGREKSLFDYRSYGMINERIARKCGENKERRIKTDKGKLIRHKHQIKRVARCMSCGRKEESDWLTREVSEEWKGGERIN